MKAEEGSVFKTVYIHAHAVCVSSRAGPEPCGVGDVHVGSGGDEAQRIYGRCVLSCLWCQHSAWAPGREH